MQIIECGCNADRQFLQSPGAFVTSCTVDFLIYRTHTTFHIKINEVIIRLLQNIPPNIEVSPNIEAKQLLSLVPFPNQ